MRTLTAHKKWVNAIAWEPLHLSKAIPRFASASKDGQIRVWEALTGRCVTSLSGHAMSVSCLRWGGDGLIFSGSQDRTIKVAPPANA